jgi:tetratricopeptide (TPR) repeat protein
LAVIVVSTAAAIAGLLWWSDRPNREIERALNHRDFELALRLATSHLGESPDNSRTLDQKARALVGLGMWSEAERLFEQIGAESAASQKAWSQALLHQERWSEAVALLTRLNDIDPDDPELLHELAVCQSKLGFFDEALKAAERLMRVPGREATGRVLLGTLQFQRGNNRLAIEAWQPILEHNPEATGLQLTAAEFLAGLGRALLEEGHADEARRQLERAVQLDPAGGGRNDLAEACEQLGDVPRAVALWRVSVARSPGDRTAREGLARTALEKGDADEAREWLEPLLRAADLQSSTAYLMQRAERLRGDKAAAAEWSERVQNLRKREKKMNALDQALRESPRSFWSRAVRAHRFASDGNTHQALLLTTELLKQQPDQPFVQQLDEALRNREPLPSLDLIPYEQF